MSIKTTYCLIHELFERQVNLNPESIALEFNDKNLTYTELNTRANSLALSLIESGVQEGQTIGICVERSFDLIISVLAVLKAGASYLPLDPEYPESRLAYMLENSQTKTILFSNELRDKLPKNLNLNELSLDEIEYKKDAQNILINKDKVNLGYIIYTSGSTGNPKGVSMGHKALVNLINWQNADTKLNADCKTLQFTPLSFDVHFQEIFSTLSMGGTLVLISEQMRLDSLALLKHINDKKINRLFLPFVALNHLAEMGVEYNIYPSSLVEVITAGEQLKVTKTIRGFFNSLSNYRTLSNHYGPSETHVITALTLTGDANDWDQLPSIGKPITNTQVLLLDKEFNETNEGEMYLLGECLADGYINNIEMTEKTFINHPTYGRIYKSGDMAKIGEDGNIIYLGRGDGQVKIRGYRIELSEVEVALDDIEDIDKACIKVFESDGEKYISAFYTGDINAQDLRLNLKEQLPEYMVPSYFYKLESLPLTPSGKIDRKSLTEPKRVRPELTCSYRKPKTELEKLLISVFEKHLKIEGIGILDNFFDLGGNSLVALKVLAQLKSNHDLNIPIVKLFQEPTIEALVRFIEGSNTKTKSYTDYVKDNHHDCHDIAIISMSGKFPGAKNINEFWENILSGKNSISTFSKDEADASIPTELLNDQNYVLAKGFYPDYDKFDAKYFGITPNEAKLMDPQQRKFLELSVEALQTAGYSSSKYEGSIGVFAGMGNNTYINLVNDNPSLISKVGQFNVMLANEKDYIATRVAHKLNLTGPALSLHTGCSTSLVSIIEAVKSLRLGECDMALAGGIAISGTPHNGYLFQSGGILSQDGVCRPFDSKATGTVFNDGGGVLVLKRLDKAIEDKDYIHALIKGVGLNNDGAKKASFTAPSIDGQVDVILRAQGDGQVSPESIGYIESHGTATPVGDPIEFSSLNQAFSSSTDKKNYSYIGAVKGNVGHLTSAAGVAGVIKAVKVVNTGIIPKLANFTSLNSNIDEKDSAFIFPKENTTFPKLGERKRAAISSFGVGGTNAHLIIEDYLNSESKSSFTGSSLLKLSAKGKDELEELTNLTLSNLDGDLEKASFTLDQGRDDNKYKRFIIVDRENQKLTSLNSKSSSLEEKREVTFMFPGQGSQYLDMGKKLSSLYPIFKENFDRCSEILKPLLNVDLREIKDADVLKNTFYTQPAIFAFEYSLAMLYLSSGMIPNIMIGHSVGEFVAASLSGVFSLEDGLKMISKRASLMSALPSGSMLSISKSADDILNLIKENNSEDVIQIAAVNSRNLCVVAGPDLAIDQFIKSLEDRDITSRKLQTSHAFHSAMMNPVLDDFKQFVSTVHLQEPTLPLISTVTGKIESELFTRPEYWSNHMRATVDFNKAVSFALSDSDNALLEIGPRNTLATLAIKEALALKIKDHQIIASNQGKLETEDFAFKFSLGRLWLAGVDFNLMELINTTDRVRVPLATYPFIKKRLWLDREQKTESTIQTKIMKKEVNMSEVKQSNLQAKISEIFEDASGIDITEFSSDTTFLEMGMDSLFLTQVSLSIKKELKVEITFRQLMEEYSSVDAIIENFSDQISSDLLGIDEAAINNEPMENTTVSNVQVSTTPIQNNQAPVMPNLSGVSNLPNDGSVQALVNKQLELMGQQLQLLSGVSSQAMATQAVSMQTKASQTAPSVQKEKTESKTDKKEFKRGTDVNNSKKAFGACARINTITETSLTSEQEEFFKNFSNDYNEKTKSSKKFAQDNRVNHADPRSVTGFRPEMKELTYPIVVNKSKNQTLTDLDGNEYIDMTCGFGSNFFGNGNERIKKYVLEQLESGIEIGPQHPLTADVSKLACELTGFDRAAFCNTGSEAVLGAMRVARTVTGRDKIIVFNGSYHGICDEVIIRGSKSGKSFPGSPGITSDAVQNMIVLEYGTQESLEKVKELSAECAAVLVEPVQSRRSDFHPKEFLQEIRKITKETDTCLIFDEVITGFRIHPGGARAFFDVDADLGTYGKIIGGGMPIGMLAGKKEYMDALDGGFWQYGDESTPTVGVTYFAGTFVRHPLALAAAKGSLEIIKEGGEKLLNDVTQRADNFCQRLNLFFNQSGLPLKMDNFGSLMKPKWKEEVKNGDLLFTMLRFNGVHVYDGFPWFVNLAHTEAELEEVIQRVKRSVATLQFNGFLPGSQALVENSEVFLSQNPPCEGAKLGVGSDGNPAWFIEKDGELRQIEK